MAKEIPQLQESQPILNNQKIESGAEGYEAFAKTLGSLAVKAEEKSETMFKDASNAMYLTSVADIDKLKRQSQEAMLTDPANALRHSETMNKSMDQILKNAYVNETDRAKLKRYAVESAGTVELDSVRTNVNQQQIGMAFEHYKNWPAQLNALKSSTMGDEKDFTNLQNSMLEHIHSLMLTGVLTPHQGAAAVESMTDVVKLAHEAHEFYQNTNLHNAQNFHAVNSNPLEPNKTGNIDYPVDESTRWLVNYHYGERTFQEIQDDLHNHLLPPMQEYENLSDHQRQQLKLESNGIRRADGLIDSGSTIPKIKDRIKDLDRNTDYGSNAEQKYLKQYVEDSKNGNSQRIMARTAMGGQIVQDYTAKSAYLDNKLSTTDPKNTAEIASIKSQIADNKNDYVNKSVAYAEAHHVPVVHPIPVEDVSVVTNSFKLGSDPVEAVNVMKQYSRQNQLYLADQLTDPKHKIAVMTIALSGNKSTDQEKADFISANQPGRYKELDLTTEDKTTKNGLRNSINTQIPDAFKIISAQNQSQNATILSENLIATSANYAKYVSEKNRQFSLKEDASVFDSVANVSSATQLVNNAYKALTGANYIINSAQVDVGKKDMDSVAEYAINQSWERLGSKVGDITLTELKSRTPLTVTITPQNVLIAQDSNGNVYFRAPFSTDLIAHAKEEVTKSRENKIKEESEVFKPIKEKMFVTGNEEQLQEIQLNNNEEKGMIEKGNIDLSNRKKLRNEDGGYSTVNTITIEEDGKTVLLPTIINGKQVTEEEAKYHYKKTGEHMGKFNTEKEANKYDEKLHKEKGWNGEKNKWK